MKLHNNNEYQNIKCRYEIHIGIFLSNSRVIKLQSFGVSVSARLLGTLQEKFLATRIYTLALTVACIRSLEKAALALAALLHG